MLLDPWNISSPVKITDKSLSENGYYHIPCCEWFSLIIFQQYCHFYQLFRIRSSHDLFGQTFFQKFRICTRFSLIHLDGLLTHWIVCSGFSNWKRKQKERWMRWIYTYNKIVQMSQLHNCTKLTNVFYRWLHSACILWRQFTVYPQYKKARQCIAVHNIVYSHVHNTVCLQHFPSK